MLTASPHPLPHLAPRNSILQRINKKKCSGNMTNPKWNNPLNKIKILNQRCLSIWPVQVTLEWSSKSTSLTHNPELLFSVVDPRHCQQTTKGHLTYEGALQHGRQSRAMWRIQTMQGEESFLNKCVQWNKRRIHIQEVRTQNRKQKTALRN